MGNIVGFGVGRELPGVAVIIDLVRILHYTFIVAAWLRSCSPRTKSTPWLSDFQ